MAEFVIPVSKDDYEKAGSKFITMGQNETEAYRNVEFGMPDWKTAGKSIVFPATVVGGVDDGKEQSIFAGVDTNGVWKLKEILKAIGVDVTFNKAGQPMFDAQAVFGKKATARFIWETGHKDGDKNQPVVRYPKMVDIMPVRGQHEGTVL
jgi:hypothetical protein